MGPVRHRHRLLGAAAVAFALVAPAGTAAQPTTGWTITRDAFAELWYHGLATAGVEGFGPVPLYSDAYVRAARPREHGPLAALAPALRAAMHADSALDVLHFVPLYFVGEPPHVVLPALRRALGRAAGAPPVARSDGSVGVRARAVAAALPAGTQRAIVGRFVAALESEWRDGIRDERVRRAPDAQRLEALRSRWRDEYAPALSPHLRASGRPHGIIVLVPALGLDGRILALGRGTTVVAVAADPHPELADGPLLAAVRELAYPLLDRVPAALAGAGTRADAERRRGIAAIRAGEMVLARTAPSLASRYRRLFAGDAAFDVYYPLPRAAEAALRAAASSPSP